MLARGTIPFATQRFPGIHALLASSPPRIGINARSSYQNPPKKLNSSSNEFFLWRLINCFNTMPVRFKYKNSGTEIGTSDTVWRWSKSVHTAGPFALVRALAEA